MKSQLYTRTGDSGTTSLVGGQRVRKNSARLEAYGTIDELSSCLGAFASGTGCGDEVRKQVMEVQNELFNIGCYLATAVGEDARPECSSLTPAKMEEMEHWIDALDEATPKIRAFVLPGGSPAASAAHIARTVCRRAERRILDLAELEYVDPRVISYINRLSDYLFIAARHANHRAGFPEVIWKQ